MTRTSAIERPCWAWIKFALVVAAIFFAEPCRSMYKTNQSPGPPPPGYNAANTPGFPQVAAGGGNLYVAPQPNQQYQAHQAQQPQQLGRMLSQQLAQPPQQFGRMLSQQLQMMPQQRSQQMMAQQQPPQQAMPQQVMAPAVLSANDTFFPKGIFDGIQPNEKNSLINYTRDQNGGEHSWELTSDGLKWHMLPDGTTYVQNVQGQNFVCVDGKLIPLDASVPLQPATQRGNGNGFLPPNVAAPNPLAQHGNGFFPPNLQLATGQVARGADGRTYERALINGAKMNIIETPSGRMHLQNSANKGGVIFNRNADGNLDIMTPSQRLMNGYAAAAGRSAPMQQSQRGYPFPPPPQQQQPPMMAPVYGDEPNPSSRLTKYMAATVMDGTKTRMLKEGSMVALTPEHFMKQNEKGVIYVDGKWKQLVRAHFRKTEDGTPYYEATSRADLRNMGDNTAKIVHDHGGAHFQSNTVPPCQSLELIQKVARLEGRNAKMAYKQGRNA